MTQWNKATRAQEGDPLTRRELEILALVAAGHPTVEIAQQLRIRPATIKTHLTSVYRKIGAKNRVQATRHYLHQLSAQPPHGGVDQ
jgi:DNA-binding CsgD family transcriptional regulator